MNKENIEAVYSLSPLQEGVLLDCIQGDESGRSTGYMTCLIDGGLDVFAFEQALQRIINRHEMLRTFFVWERLDKPIQVAVRHLELSLDKQDWREIDADDRRKRFDEIFSNPDHLPLVRAGLYQLSNTKYQFVWQYHRLILDERSCHILLEEIFACYKAICTGMDLPVQTGISFRNYLSWLKQQNLSEASFWQRELDGFLGNGPLCIERFTPGSSEAQRKPDRVTFQITEATTELLKSFMKEHNLSLNTIIQAGCALLISLYSGDKDVMTGIRDSGRPNDLHGAGSMIGPFATLIPMRVQLAPSAHKLNWLKALNERQALLSSHQYNSLRQIRTWAGLGESLSIKPVIILDNQSADSFLPSRHANIKVYDVDVCVSKDMPITLKAQLNRQLELKVSYNSHRFDHAPIIKMLEHLEGFLEGIANDRQKQLWQVTSLTQSERERLRAERNSNRRNYPSDLQTHELIERQCKETPDRVAVSFEKEAITYDQLDRRANRLAHQLRHLGVFPESVVAILSDRDIELVITILAVFKAGGAYLALEPADPISRQSNMIRASNAELVLTRGKWEDVARQTAGQQGARVEVIERLMEEGRDETGLESYVERKNLSYIFYTSGSTGEPKGAMVEQEGMRNHIYAKIWDFEISGADKVAQNASQSFDVSVWQMMAGLMVGAEVRVMSKQEVKDAQESVRQVRREEITIMEVVPSQLRGIIEAMRMSGEKGAMRSVRKMFVMGEVLSVEMCKEWDEESEGVKIVNGWGTTECSDDVTHNLVRREEMEAEERIGLGRALWNMRVYVRDEEGREVGEGVEGELVVGGVCVGRGYIGEGGKTGEVYVPEEESEEGGERVYRTGDRGLRRRDGKVEYVGRKDEQVKVRGYRIEMGEIEAAMKSMEEVKEAVVVVREEGRGEKRLIGYIVNKGGKSATLNEMKRKLRERLPEYMVPTGIIVLDEMPLTANGKVDRKALPAPDEGRPQMDNAYVAPENHIEEILVGIWSNVLGIESVGINDNFFELGGDSILSLQVSAMGTEAGLRFSPTEIFERPTIKELAEVVKVVAPGASLDSPIRPLPLTQSQQSLLERYETSVDVLELETNEQLDPEKLREVFRALVTHHDALRLRLKLNNGLWEQHCIAVEPETPFAVIDLTRSREEDIQNVIEETSDKMAQAISITEGPVINVALLKGQASRLIIATHPLAVDDKSWEILLQDLSLGYRLLNEGKRITFGKKKTTFMHWAEFAGAETPGNITDAYRYEEMREPHISPVNPSPGEIRERQSRLKVCLGREATARLLELLQRPPKMRITELLVAALLSAIKQSDWNSVVEVETDSERDDNQLNGDISRTVGRIAKPKRLIPEMNEWKGHAAELKYAKELMRSNGHGFETGTRADLRVRLRFSGNLDNTFDKFDAGVRGIESQPGAETRDGLNLSVIIANGDLTIALTADGNASRPDNSMAQQIGERMIESLRALIEHCLSSDAADPVPSDYPKARISEKDLSKLLAKFN
jgi:amino acid adenylation domain-containing protein